VRLTHIDGSLPNLALMRLSAFHRDRGDDVHFTSSIERGLLETDYERVYGSAIFAYSRPRVDRFLTAWPQAIVGGTGTGVSRTVEEFAGDSTALDYSIYPKFKASMGFTQRGCRLSCKFCVVPSKEGKNRSVATIAEIWRGSGHAKKLHLLDNDFFGQPREQWRARVREINDGGFRVCLNQGINVRLIDDEAAEALASMRYRDDSFSRRRIYTAWDNLGDQRIFEAGIRRLERAGIDPGHVMAYMLIGFDPKETMGRIFHRFDRMVSMGVLPYPMVYDRTVKKLREFQRWAVTGLYRTIPFDKYQANYKSANRPSSPAQRLLVLA
jgi:hypothetical protein